jgi:NAD(P)-dependent dehydrogenase (short-subunit alcohol dehydrogenase family)
MKWGEPRCTRRDALRRRRKVTLVAGVSRRIGAAIVRALARGAAAVALTARIVAGGRAPGGAVG